MLDKIRGASAASNDVMSCRLTLMLYQMISVTLLLALFTDTHIILETAISLTDDRRNNAYVPRHSHYTNR